MCVTPLEVHTVPDIGHCIPHQGILIVIVVAVGIGEDVVVPGKLLAKPLYVDKLFVLHI